MPWISGCSSSRSTATLSPCTTLKTPSGSPASFHSSAIHNAAEGSCSLGFRTTVLPVAMAMGKNHIGTIAGKLNGLMIATGPSGWRTECTSTPVEAFSVNPPRTSEGTPQANSTTSWPRETSPRASSRTLPCSAVISAASSGLRALSSSRKRNSTAVRLVSEVSRQPGKAAAAAPTAASTSSTEASATSPVTWPVAESVTGAVRPLAPSRRAPPIQCGMELGMVIPFRWGSSGAGGVGKVLADQLADRGQHPAAGLAGLVVPAEHAGGQDAVETDAGQRGERRVEVDVAAADLQVLVHPGGIARRIGDVAQPVGGGVVHRVGDVHVAEQRTGAGDDPGRVVALVEGVRQAVEEGHGRGVDPPDQVHRRGAELDEVIRMRLQRQLDALPLEDRQQLLHRPPEHRLGQLGGLRAAVELAVHCVHAQLGA